MAWQTAKNPYANGRQQPPRQQEEYIEPRQQNNNGDDKPIVGFCDLFESNPEYSTVAYGTLVIPVELIAQAVEAGETKELFGQEAVVLAIAFYEFSREWSFETPPPMLEGRIKRKAKSERGGGRQFKQRQGQRRRF